MGHPPRKLVMEKLIKRYFKKAAQVSNPEAVRYKMQLANCWEKFGVNNQKCAHLIDAYDHGWGLEIVTRDKALQSTKNYPDKAMEYLDCSKAAAKKKQMYDDLYWQGYQKKTDPLKPPTLY